MLAWSIAQKVAKILQDESNIRCTVEELVMWFNSAQREIVNIKPDSLTANGSITLVSGTKQSAAVVTANSVAKTGLKLLDIIRNTGAYTRAVAGRKRSVLDAMLPGWHSSAAKAEVKFFMVDERDPLTFYVYPPQPAAGTGVVEALVSIAPVDVTISVDGLTFTAAQAFSFSDQYENSQIDLMLWRALSKDSKNVNNMSRAQTHYSVAAAALGQKVQANRYYAPRDSFSQSSPAGQQQ